MSEHANFTQSTDPYQADRLSAFESHAYLQDGNINERMLDEMPLEDMPIIRARMEVAVDSDELLVGAIDAFTEKKIVGEVEKTKYNKQEDAYYSLWDAANEAYRLEKDRIESDNQRADRNDRTTTPQSPAEHPLADVIRSMNARKAGTRLPGEEEQGHHIGSISLVTFSHLQGATEGSTHEEIDTKSDDGKERRQREQDLSENIGEILVRRQGLDGIPRSLAQGFQPYGKPLLAETKEKMARSRIGKPIEPLVVGADPYKPRLLEGIGLARRDVVKAIKDTTKNKTAGTTRKSNKNPTGKIASKLSSAKNAFRREASSTAQDTKRVAPDTTLVDVMKEKTNPKPLAEEHAELPFTNPTESQPMTELELVKQLHDWMEADESPKSPKPVPGKPDHRAVNPDDAGPWKGDEAWKNFE